MLIAQFNVPVRKIDKMLPEIVLRRGKSDLDERPPFVASGRVPVRTLLGEVERVVPWPAVAGPRRLNTLAKVEANKIEQIDNKATATVI